MATKKNSKKDVTYMDICERCGRDFTFKESEVVERVIKCPHCGRAQIFIKSNYK